MSRPQTNDVTDATTAAINAQMQSLSLETDTSLSDARHGFIGTLDKPIIRNDQGRAVWDLSRFADFVGESPSTVNPSLWRMAKLNLNHGLFEVTDRIFQIRGFDISNMTVVVGERGYIVIDPLISGECARAGMDLVREHLGDKPVTAVIYTHSHVDHFGGVGGVITLEQFQATPIPIVAPAHFLHHAVSENVYAGNAMRRRAEYMYGAALPAGPSGYITTGLGIATSRGTVSLIAPTETIDHSGQRLTLDGIEVVFQYTPDSEAPSEMNFHFPQLRALCMAENVSHNMHNVYTLRGAQIRDARAWAQYIYEADALFCDQTDVVFISHHWPVFGKAKVRQFLTDQADMYKFMHDQTLRLANHGFTMNEIAERIVFPERLGVVWANRGYYGTLRHNVKAVYQRYLGWFDGNPAHLDPHEPAEAASRYVEYMGGGDAVVEKARRSYAEGDYRWVAEVLNHVVFADAENQSARELLADAYEQLGYQAESGPWRNFYLTGARELRLGTPEPAAPGPGQGAGMSGALSIDMLIDYLAIRFNSDVGGQLDATIGVHLSDIDDEFVLIVRNGVVRRATAAVAGTLDTQLSLPRQAFVGLAYGVFDLDHPAVTCTGNRGIAQALLAACDQFNPRFPIIEP